MPRVMGGNWISLVPKSTRMALHTFDFDAGRRDGQPAPLESCMTVSVIEPPSNELKGRIKALVDMGLGRFVGAMRSRRVQEAGVLARSSHAPRRRTVAGC
jgi:hypothetical protein